MKNSVPARLSALKTSAIGVCGLLGLVSTAAFSSSAPDEQALMATWRDAIARTPVPSSGCFHASYPDMTWQPVACGPAPSRLYLPRSDNATSPDSVGNGADYAAKSAGKITQTVGSFPSATGTAGETDNGQADDFSIQLNSDFMTGTAICNGVSGCKSWQQFVYSSTSQAVFIQSWLIGIGTCPTGGSWQSGGSGDCVMNSNSVNVPTLTSAELSTVKMSGAATSTTDTAVFTVGSQAYSTTTPDSTTNLASAWGASEFNVIGDGNRSAATFLNGTSITVNIAITDGTTNAPTCEAKGGTTGETNNLNFIGSCVATGGSSPSIEFVEALGVDGGGLSGDAGGSSGSGDSGTTPGTDSGTGKDGGSSSSSSSSSGSSSSSSSSGSSSSSSGGSSSSSSGSGSSSSSSSSGSGSSSSSSSSGASPGDDGGASFDASIPADGGSSGAGNNGGSSSSGCGCSTVGAGESFGGMALGLGLAFGLIARRRRNG